MRVSCRCVVVLQGGVLSNIGALYCSRSQPPHVLPLRLASLLQLHNRLQGYHTCQCHTHKLPHETM